MQNNIVTVLPSKALTATETGSAVDIAAFFGVAEFVLNSSATDAAGKTSAVKIQHSDDGANGWTDAGIAFDTVDATAGGKSQVVHANIDGLKRFIRGVNTMAGSSPTVTSGVVMLARKNA